MAPTYPHTIPLSLLASPSMMRLSPLVLTAFVTLLHTAGCASTPPPFVYPNPSNLPLTAEVVFTHAFRPPLIELAPGATLTLVNADDYSHTITLEGFFSTDITPGASYQHTFTAPGHYTLYEDHVSSPASTLTVIVR